jgi:hypothetical protein
VAQDFWTVEVLAENVISGWTRSADVDGDSDADVFVQNGDTLFWYENLNPGWTKHLIDPAFIDVPYSWVEDADMDGDGDPDVLYAGFIDPGEIAWSENKMNGTEWERHVVDPGGRGNGVFQKSVGDLDSDGDSDVALPAISSGEVSWYELATDSVTWVRHPVASLTSALWTTVGDMDGDDDLDIVSASGSSGGLHWYENQFPDTVWVDHFVANLFGSWGGEIADLDGDGSNDIVTHNFSSLLAYMGPSLSVTLLASGFTGLQLGCLGDIDQDEDIDVTFGGDGFGTSGDIGWLENPGSVGSWVRHDIADGSLLQRIPTGLADIDLDGDIDMTSYSFNVATTIADAVWYANPGQVSSTEGHQHAFVPEEAFLDQNYPNPFNPGTAVRFGIPERMSVVLSVYNILGELAEVLVDDELDGGTYEAVFRSGGMSTGLYFCVLTTPASTITRRMILLR